MIIDDEEPAHIVLKNFINRLPQLSLAGTAYSAVEALHVLHTATYSQEKIDIVFLDITMPDMSGMELFAALKNQAKTETHPFVILCTAHSNHALESYEYGVTDYLLKPIAFPRFVKAVQRVEFMLSQMSLSLHSELSAVKTSSPFTFVIECKRGSLGISEIVYTEYIQGYSGNEILIDGIELPVGRTFKKLVEKHLMDSK